MSEKYVFGEAEYESELRRLQAIEKIFDDGSEAVLKPTGVGRGWQCLEVGAGGWVNCAMVECSDWSRRRSNCGGPELSLLEPPFRGECQGCRRGLPYSGALWRERPLHFSQPKLDGDMGHGRFQQALWQLGFPESAIEPEHERIEGFRQGLPGDAVEGPPDEALEMGDHQVALGQPLAGPLGRRHARLVVVARAGSASLLSRAAPAR